MPTLPRPVYVAATGNDISGQGTLLRPFATVQRAVAFRRTRGWASTMTAEQTVNVAAGTYYSPVTMTDADNGGNGFDVVYQCTGAAGSANIVGGYLASGWVDQGGGIYKVAVSAPVTTLYENGIRATMARLPVLNPGVSFPCAFAPYFTTTTPNDNRAIMGYNPVDYNPSTWTFNGVRVFMWSVVGAPQTAWFVDWHGIPGADFVGHTFNLDNSGVKFYTKVAATGSRYFIAGELSMLTVAGTFVSRQESGQWYLYYKGRDGIAPNQSIVIPTSKRIVSMVGASAGARIKNIKFKGFSVTCGDFDSWYRYGTPGDGADPYDYFNTMTQFRQGGVYLENAQSVTIDSVHVKNTGFSGVFMQGAVSSCTVKNSWMEHTGGDGISVNGLTPGGGNVSTGNTFTNYKINNFGELDGSATGHRLSQSSNNTCTNWNISQGPNRAFWIHGGFSIPAADNYAYGNLVNLGEVDGVCQDSGDRGAIGMSFLSAPTPPSVNTANTFDQIRVSNIAWHASMVDANPVGLYYDNHASGQITSNIQLINITAGSRPPFFYNDCSGAVRTNCSFNDDGTPNGSFNPALMSSAIGLTAAWPF